MGNRCCAERERKPFGGSPGTATEVAPSRRGRSLAGKGVFGEAAHRRPTLSPSVYGGGTDIDTFDKAVDEKDVKTLVSLLESNHPIPPFDEQLHNWAENPKTVGALAATQLAMLVHPEHVDETPDVQKKIRDAGGLQGFVRLLDSDEIDRVQTAVVALNLVTSDGEENGEENHDAELNSKIIYEAGAMPLLLVHLKSNRQGFGSTVASTINNICFWNDEAKQNFFNSGGVALLIGLMSTDLPLLELCDLTICLHDLVEDSHGNGEFVREYAEAALKAGAKKVLEELLVRGSVNNDQKLNEEASAVLKGLLSMTRVAG